jgi:hypothetical protein
LIETIAYNKNHKDRETDDFYATPPEEVINILQYEDLQGIVLEPCCGKGHIVQGIKNSGFKGEVIATDLKDRGFGDPGLDFLHNGYPFINNIGTIITNFPFKIIEPCVLKSIKIAQHKVIVFARNQFAESESRYENIFANHPPSRIYQYVDRVSCAKDGDFTKELSNNMAFSWFVWDKDHHSETIFKWIRRHGKPKAS